MLARRSALPSGDSSSEAATLLAEAKRVREEAEAETALLEARKRLRQQEEAAEADLEQEGLAQRVKETEAKLDRAKAFQTADKDELQKELTELKKRLAEASKPSAEVSPPKPQEPAPAGPPEGAQAKRLLNVVGATTKTKLQRYNRELTEEDYQDLATRAQDMSPAQLADLGVALGRDGRQKLSEAMDEKREDERKKEEAKETERMEAAKQQAKDLRSKLSFDKVKEMKPDELMGLAAELGPAFTVSIPIVGICYWTVNLIIFTAVYYYTTGELPNPSLLSSMDTVEAGGLIAGIVSVAVLLKPVRLLLAVLLTPWTAEHVMPRLPWAANEEKDQQVKK